MLISELLKIDNENTIAELETIVRKLKRRKQKKIYADKDFLGVWSKEEGALIEKAIEEGCEPINEDIMFEKMAHAIDCVIPKD